ncbi:NAD(+) diphosphatase [Natronosporangium hydrolyticum]|uniref:NAD(+) diphosphatase n=1 Tax=Natronosporangium hydrolyticum TaxID=2811111 RepID=A0A895YNY1_9ACTN|nr:NAD(+) diphosphatase [Natronosporangium hydrolyticum]QSB15658.1 NAD(+) diphosphatase [Natronosporangium hydrolyticum]
MTGPSRPTAARENIARQAAGGQATAGQATAGQAAGHRAAPGQISVPQIPAGPPLARAGVDRAALRRGDPQWLAEAWSRSRVLVVDPKGRAFCAAADSATPELVFSSAEAAPAGERFFLGQDQAGVPYFAVVSESPTPPHAGARLVSLREVGAELNDRDAGLLTTAASLVNWHARHRFSPMTGEATTPADGGWIRVDSAGQHLFPRTDPAVIMLIHDGVAGPAGQCLLARNATWRHRPGGRRFFSILAGFVEPGESAEAAVVREVYEEVGVPVSGLRYQASQAWPYPGSLMLGFTGVGDPAQPLRLEPTEIAEARWFTRAEVAALLPERPDPTGAPYGEAPAGSPLALPGPASIAHYLIHGWVAELEQS